MKGCPFSSLFLPPQSSLPDDGFFTEADTPLHKLLGEGGGTLMIGLWQMGLRLNNFGLVAGSFN